MAAPDIACGDSMCDSYSQLLHTGTMSCIETIKPANTKTGQATEWRHLCVWVSDICIFSHFKYYLQWKLANFHVQSSSCSSLLLIMSINYSEFLEHTQSLSIKFSVTEVLEFYWGYWAGFDSGSFCNKVLFSEPTCTRLQSTFWNFIFKWWNGVLNRNGWHDFLACN